MDGKTIAIISHLTIIGTIVSYFLYYKEKDEFAGFYIRQSLCLWLLAFIAGVIPTIGWILWIVIIVFILMSLMWSVNGDKREVPVVGKYFQDWLKFI